MSAENVEAEGSATPPNLEIIDAIAIPAVDAVHHISREHQPFQLAPFVGSITGIELSTVQERIDAISVHKGEPDLPLYGLGGRYDVNYASHRAHGLLKAKAILLGEVELPIGILREWATEQYFGEAVVQMLARSRDRYIGLLRQL